MLKFVIIVLILAGIIYCYHNGMFSDVEKYLDNLNNNNVKQELMDSTGNGLGVVRYKSFAEVLSGKQ